MDIRNLLDQPREVFENYVGQRAKTVPAGNRQVLSRVLGKYLMFLDPTDLSLSPHLMMEGYWESWITLAMARLPEDIHCIDVGANCGYYTILLADLCGSVTAYEPQGELRNLLRKTAAVCGFRDRVTIHAHPVGISGELGVIQALPGHLDALGSYFVEVTSDCTNPAAIETVSLDEMHKDQKIGFVKIDAEGFEPKVWAGMQRIVKEDRPIIAMEFTHYAYPDARTFLEEILLWYPLREIDSGGCIVPVTIDQILGRKDFSMLWLEH